MRSLPLQGIRVIDLTHAWAAPHATRLLADFGAEVIKVEYVRRLCILRGATRGAAMYDHQPGWAQVNRNKISMTLDLAREDDRAVFRDLVRISDVLVENSRTGVLQRFGLGYRDLVAIRPDLVMLSMAAFGNTGPWAARGGYGAVFEGLSGVMGLTAYARGGKPSRIKEIDTINGLVGAAAIMTALVHRQRTGRGQHLDLSQLEAATHATAGEHLLEWEMNRHQTLPLGNRHPRFAPQGCYRAHGNDRWIAITVRSDDEWRRCAEIMGHPEWASDPRFVTAAARRAHHDEIDELIASWTTPRDHVEAMHLLQGAGIPAAAVLHPDEIRSDPHLAARGYFAPPTEVPGPVFMGTPIRLNGEAPPVRRPGPRLGEHDAYVRCHLLGRSAADVPVVRPEDIGLAYDPEPPPANS